MTTDPTLAVNTHRCHRPPATPGAEFVCPDDTCGAEWTVPTLGPIRWELVRG